MSVAAIILSLIVLAAIGVAMLQLANALFARERQYYQWNYHRDILLMDAVVLVLYLLLSAMVVYVYVAFRFEPMVLYCWMLLLVVLSIILLARHIWMNRESMKVPMAIGFALWFLIVLYLTLFSRVGTSQGMQVDLTPFRGISAALEQRSLEPLTHVFLNVLLFIPFGYLLPCCNPVALSRAGFAILGGLIASTVIEGLQMVLGLGMCDIDDIIANALGAIIGYLGYLLWRQIQKNWKTF